MRPNLLLATSLSFLLACSVNAQTAPEPDPIATLVGRLDLAKYKATIRGLTKFGDRRQGTDRNRAAIDWIEAQLKSYGCTNTERIHYEYQPPAVQAAPRSRTGAEDVERRPVEESHGGDRAPDGRQ